MDRPGKLVFSDEATFTFVQGKVLVFLMIPAIVLVLVRVTSDAALTDLLLPTAAILALWLMWVGILAVVAWAHRIGEIRGINRIFAGEIWECWQLSASAWQAVVRAESDLISPQDEGLEAYQGVIPSSIVGLVIALILTAVGIFVIDDPLLKPIIFILAVGIFLLMLMIGLFQPLVARFTANRYRRKALRVAEPRIWFARDGIYHEALGYTSLKELQKVTDRTRSRKAIQFTLLVSTESSDYTVPFLFPVPAGWEARAGKLARRYRQERLTS